MNKKVRACENNIINKKLIIFDLNVIKKFDLNELFTEFIKSITL